MTRRYNWYAFLFTCMKEGFSVEEDQEGDVYISQEKQEDDDEELAEMYQEEYEAWVARQEEESHE